MGIRTRLEQQFDYDIVDEFLDHFDIMTEVMEPTIIALEKEPLRDEKINELFRLFHNIKSASSFLRLERIQLVAELAEEMMERLRSNSSNVDAEIIDWLLVVSDQLRDWYLQISNDGELEDTSPKILKIPE
ncbi:Hpt domain-containing protein [Hydrogenimonas sp.]|uniref:Hpt domain-containing protein n=1 Tax=Hydrogenimonas sp. TaxID=2231112 RepID=UPI00262DD6E6|nr:Hpt domain-containing protein [Hydrogenimonas sp.]